MQKGDSYLCFYAGKEKKLCQVILLDTGLLAFREQWGLSFHLQKTLQTSLLKLLNQLCQRIQHCSEGWKNPMGGREHGRQWAGELPGHAQAMPRAGRWHWFCWANPSQVGLGDICLHSQRPHRFAIHQRVHMALLMQILEECCCWC